MTERLTCVEIERAYANGRRDFAGVVCEADDSNLQSYVALWRWRVRKASAEMTRLIEVIAATPANVLGLAVKQARVDELYGELNALFRVRDVITACTPVGVASTDTPAVGPFSKAPVPTGARFCAHNPAEQGICERDEALPHRCIHCGEQRTDREFGDGRDFVRLDPVALRKHPGIVRHVCFECGAPTVEGAELCAHCADPSVLDG